MLALEREEHAFGRLVRGLVSRLALLGEKVVARRACAFAVTLVMLCGIGDLRGTSTGARFALWVVALAGGAVGFGALGVAIGALAREVRAASLLAFLLTLPIAFLALVPAGTVASWLYDVDPRASRRCSPSGRRCRRSTRRSTTPARPGADAGAPRRPRRRLPGARPRGAARAFAGMTSAMRMRLEAPPDGDPPDPPLDDDAAAARRCGCRQSRAHRPVGPDARRELLHRGGPAPGARPRSALVGGGQRLRLRDPRDRRAATALIGRVALSNVVRGPWQNATLGYWIDKDALGRGHATRAVQLVLRFAFEHAGLHRVQPAIIPRNIRSVRVAEKAGFRLRGPRAALPEDQRRAGRTTTSTPSRVEDWEARGHAT